MFWGAFFYYLNHEINWWNSCFIFLYIDVFWSILSIFFPNVSSNRMAFMTVVTFNQIIEPIIMLPNNAVDVLLLLWSTKIKISLIDVGKIRILIIFLFFYRNENDNCSSLHASQYEFWSQPTLPFPQYAVDDQVNNTLYGAHCAHTINNTTPWLTIDLDRIETLGKESFFLF